MKMKKRFFGIAVFVTVMAAFVALAACSQPTDNTPAPDPGPVPVITMSVQPKANTEVTAGSISGSLSVTAAVTENAVLSYQWYSNTGASNEGGSAIDGAAAKDFTIPAALPEGTYYYFCELTAPRAAAVRSNAATVTVKKAQIPPAPRIDITSQPALNTEVTAGYITGNLSVTANGANGAADIKYQWYSNTSASKEGGSEISGAAAKDFPIPTTLAEGTYYYFCEVTASNVETPVRSNAATVTVIAAVPAITVTNPASLTVKAGDIKEKLSVEASEIHGAKVAGYQWYSNATQSNTGGTAITGATDKSFTIPPELTVGEYFYYCVVTSVNNVVAPKSSSAAKVTVSNFAATVVIAVNEDPELVETTAELNAGETKTFSVEGDWETYKWYMEGGELYGEIGETYDFVNGNSGVYVLTVVVTDAGGNDWSGSCRIRVR